MKKMGTTNIHTIFIIQYELLSFMEEKMIIKNPHSKIK
jgi:hypothetical protein